MIHRSLFVGRLRPSRATTGTTDAIGVHHGPLVSLLTKECVVKRLLESLRLLVLLGQPLGPGFHHLGVLAKIDHLIFPETVATLEVVPVTSHHRTHECLLNLLIAVLPVALIELSNGLDIPGLFGSFQCLTFLGFVLGVGLCDGELGHSCVRFLGSAFCGSRSGFYLLDVSRINRRRLNNLGGIRSREVGIGTDWLDVVMFDWYVYIPS